MAVIYQKRNPLQKKAQRCLLGGTCFAVPLVLYMLAFFLYRVHLHGFYHLLPFALFGWPAAYLLQRHQTLRAGLNGERAALRSLAELPDEYYVFTSVQSEVEGKKGEIDCLAVGKNGLFVVEVKNHNGKICADEHEEYWVQHKVGRKGGAYTNKIRNPLRQTKRNVYLLSQRLQAQGMRAWIEGLVYFTNDKLEMERLPAGCYTSGSDVNSYILTYRPKRMLSEREVRSIVEVLQRG